MDTVYIRNLSIHGKHGVGAEERSIEQEFLLDIEVEMDLRAAAQSDDLKDTANYVDFADTAREVIQSNSFYLIEKLAQTIADKILLDTRIAKIRISIRKPAVLPSGVPGITIERSRI